MRGAVPTVVWIDIDMADGTIALHLRNSKTMIMIQLFGLIVHVTSLDVLHISVKDRPMYSSKCIIGIKTIIVKHLLKEVPTHGMFALIFSFCHQHILNSFYPCFPNLDMEFQHLGLDTTRTAFDGFVNFGLPIEG